MITDLGEIKVTPLAGPRDWEGYPPGYEKHPARNHPAFTRAVLAALRDPRDIVSLLWDPQAGVGTTLIEGLRLGYNPIGWDIDERWRALWRGLDRIREIERPYPGRVQVIVSSPAYDRTNKARGQGAKQEANQASIGSVAGCEWGEFPPGHLGGAEDVIEWVLLARQVLERCFEALMPEGKIGWIVRDRIHRGRPAGFVDLNANLLQRHGFELIGGYWRRLVPTANEQMRVKLEEGRVDHDQGLLLTAPPRPRPTIDREWALIARKPP